MSSMDLDLENSLKAYAEVSFYGKGMLALYYKNKNYETN
jgi:hypothetical protein